MLSVKGLNVILVSACGLLAACSTPGRSYTDSNLQETLEIEILPNTSKMFIYRLRVPEDQIPNSVRIERGGFQRGEEAHGIALGSSTSKRLLENAGYVVEHMGYCHEGFLTIDSSTAQLNSWVKGECKEGATEDDKKKFGLKQVLPVKLVK
jgi:hypothetical protein